MFTVAATLTLAIAVGGTASIFGVVSGVLLKAFPYREPDRVLTLWESNPEVKQPQAKVAPANYFDWRTQNTSFTALAASIGEGAMQFTVTGAHEAERVMGVCVTPSYFSVLGITPVLGRTLSPDDGTPPSEVVISYGYWQRHFGGARSVIGQQLNLENGNDQSPPPRRHTYTIVGVLPPGLPGPAEMWVRVYFEPDEATIRDYHAYLVYGRLKPGVTAARAQRELETIAGRLGRAYPKTNSNWTVRTVPLLDQLLGDVRPALLTLLAAAGCVLLIGAANLANLFLVRCLRRGREMALRTALGASRSRLVGQLLIEAGVLGLVGGLFGVGVAVGGVHLLRVLAPPSLPRVADIGVDGRVVAFCAFASITTVFLFGTLPAWQASRGNLVDFLKEGGRGTGSGRQHRLQDGLVVLQVAVALALLTGAGLLLESFAHFRRMDPGFRPEGLLAAQVSFSDERYPTLERERALLTNATEQLSAQPNVVAAAFAAALPGRGTPFTAPFTIVGDATPDPSHLPVATPNVVSPDYFEAMGMPMRRGREFLSSDDSRAVRVAIVDELLARRFFGHRDPLGQRLVTMLGRDTVEIIGLVGSVKRFGLAEDNVPTIYIPYAQQPLGRFSWSYLVVRSRGDPEGQTASLRHVLATLDPLVPVSDVQTMTERMMESIGTTRFATALASLFAVVALILGMVGIYSVLAYIVTQRRREIGIRLALGARAANVMTDVLRRGLVLAGIGVVVGSGVAWLLTRTLAALFLGVSPHDPVVFAGAAAVFAVVALAAASVPAFRTTRIDPVVALTST